MNITLPQEVNRIISTLESHGFEAYAVGGCVRDSLLGRTPQDWDITTSATPQQVKSCFARTIDTGIAHGTITVMIDRRGYEVTTYRVDGEYEDARHPKEVTFTASLREDLKRRDFTINAMAYNDRDGLVDTAGGMRDLEQGIIRCVGDPMERFSEDALRMLRAVRFSAQLGFGIEDATAAAVKQLAPTIAQVSAERIRMEMVRLLTSDHPQEMRVVYRLGLTAVFLPEFDRMMETPQNTPHHSYTVGEHTIRAICGVPAEPTLRIAMLLHDVAKPVCRTTDAAGRDHFRGHPQLGEEMAEQILRRLKFDNATIERVRRLVRYHDDRPKLTEKNIRRTISRIGPDLYPDLFTVKRADTLAQSDYGRKEKLEAIDAYEAYYQRIISRGDCLTRSELAISGRDLMAMGIQPGVQMGEILNRLFDYVLEHPEDNRKEKLAALTEIINIQDPS